MRHDAHVTAWVKHHARLFSGKAIKAGYQPQALHVYTDESGSPTHWRIRLKRQSDGDKWIRPMRRTFNPDNPFELKQPDYLDGTTLYHLHELAARPAEPVLIVEGETCADALLRLGILATTSGAADSVVKANWDILSGGIATLWPDNDEAGQRYAQAVIAKLEAIGCTAAIIDVGKLGLSHKGDCVDWLAMHPDASVTDIHALPKVSSPEVTEKVTNETTKSDLPESPVSLPSEAVDTNTQPETATETAPESDAAIIARLAALPPLQYDRERVATAKAMGVRPATLDAMVKAARQEEESERLPFSEVEPWHEAIQPDALLNEIAQTIRRFVVLEPWQADAAALWVGESMPPPAICWYFCWYLENSEIENPAMARLAEVCPIPPHAK